MLSSIDFFFFNLTKFTDGDLRLHASYIFEDLLLCCITIIMMIMTIAEFGLELADYDHVKFTLVIIINVNHANQSFSFFSNFIDAAT